ELPLLSHRGCNVDIHAIRSQVVARIKPALYSDISQVLLKDLCFAANFLQISKFLFSRFDFFSEKLLSRRIKIFLLLGQVWQYLRLVNFIEQNTHRSIGCEILVSGAARNVAQKPSFISRYFCRQSSCRPPIFVPFSQDGFILPKSSQ